MNNVDEHFEVELRKLWKTEKVAISQYKKTASTDIEALAKHTKGYLNAGSIINYCKEKIKGIR